MSVCASACVSFTLSVCDCFFKCCRCWYYSGERKRKPRARNFISIVFFQLRFSSNGAMALRMKKWAWFYGRHNAHTKPDRGKLSHRISLCQMHCICDEVAMLQIIIIKCHGQVPIACACARLGLLLLHEQRKSRRRRSKMKHTPIPSAHTHILRIVFTFFCGQWPLQWLIVLIGQSDFIYLCTLCRGFSSFLLSPVFFGFIHCTSFFMYAVSLLTSCISV